jgi:HSP20 family protein
VTTTEQKSTNGKDAPEQTAMTPTTTPAADIVHHHEHQRRTVRPFEAMMDELDRFFFDPSAGLPFARMPRDLGFANMPRMDVVEKDKSLILTAELPGVKKEDVHVEMQDGALVIRGEARSEHEDKAHDHVHLERTYGSFYRRLPLGFDAKPRDITAKLKDGVLEVRIPEPPDKKDMEDKEEMEIPIS